MAAKTRVRPCDDTQAKQRLDRAREFLDVADLVSGEKGKDDSPVYASAAASLAILAGIAASDAACCKELRQRSRSENHRDAVELLEQIAPNGRRAAKQMRELLDLKDKAQYGFLKLNSTELRKVMRRSKALTSFAEEVLSR